MRPRRRHQIVLRSTFERSLFEERRALVAWTLGLFTYAFVMTAIFPTIRDNPALKTIHSAYPEVLRSLFAIGDMATGVGYLRVEVFSTVSPVLLIIFGALWGGDLTAGEEDRGTIDLLLANPLSRQRVVLEKWASLVTGLVVASLGLGIGALGGIVIFDLDVSVMTLTAATVSVWLIGVLFGSLALAIGASTGARGLARGVTTVLAVAAYLLSTLPDLVAWLRPLRPLSPWYHALGTDPLASGFHLWHLGGVAAATVAVLGAAIVGFNRRDLGT
jgi:ABC-2 type transport system permease protein